MNTMRDRIKGGMTTQERYALRVPFGDQVLTLREIADKHGLRVSTIRSRWRIGLRGLDLVSGSRWNNGRRRKQTDGLDLLRDWLRRAA